MSNILAIAQKELKAYFSSPIAYIVIGVFALLYGYFFVAILAFFVRQSMQMSQFGAGAGQSMNINQQLVRPLLSDVTILILFMLPAITMRSRSGKAGLFEKTVPLFTCALPRVGGALLARTGNAWSCRHSPT